VKDQSENAHLDSIGRKRHAGQFGKGQSGNPRGRPRANTALAEMIRRNTPIRELVARIVEIALHSHSESESIQAATWLAERGFKKPAQVIEVAQVDAEFDGMSLDELELEEARTRAELSGEIIDVEVIEEPKALPAPAPRTLTLADLEAAEKQRNRDIAFAKKKAKRKP
jgi:hypothetical protein